MPSLWAWATCGAQSISDKKIRRGGCSKRKSLRLTGALACNQIFNVISLTPRRAVLCYSATAWLGASLLAKARRIQNRGNLQCPKKLQSITVRLPSTTNTRRGTIGKRPSTTRQVIGKQRRTMRTPHRGIFITPLTMLLKQQNCTSSTTARRRRLPRSKKALRASQIRAWTRAWTFVAGLERDRLLRPRLYFPL